MSFEKSINLTFFVAGLGDEDRDNCRKNPDGDEYSDRMKGCFAQLQQSISDNKDVISIVTGTVRLFLVRSKSDTGPQFHKTFFYTIYGHFVINYGNFEILSKFMVKIWP